MKHLNWHHAKDPFVVVEVIERTQKYASDKRTAEIVRLIDTFTAYARKRSVPEAQLHHRVAEMMDRYKAAQRVRRHPKESC